MHNNIKHFHVKGNFKGKLCRKTAALPAADAACVNNSSKRDAADQRRRRAAEVDARCVSGRKMAHAHAR